MYSYNEKDTVGKLVSNFWKISRVLRDTYDGRGSQRRVLTVLLKSGDVITQSALTERLDIQPGSARGACKAGSRGAYNAHRQR